MPLGIIGLFTGGPPARHLCVIAQVAGEHPRGRGRREEAVSDERASTDLSFFQLDEILTLPVRACAGLAYREKRTRDIAGCVYLGRSEGRKPLVAFERETDGESVARYVPGDGSTWTIGGGAWWLKITMDASARV